MFRSIVLVLCLLPCTVSVQAERLPEPTPSAAAQMFAQLETGDWRNWIPKAEALDYLSRYEVSNAQPAVQKVLDDKHPNNRWLRGQAVIAMARIDPDNAAALAKAHVQDPHVEVRVAVAQVCYDLTKDQATPILENLLEDKAPAIQFAGLAAYAKHHGEQAWPRAEPLTAKVPDQSIEPAARALGWIGNEPALARLRELLAGSKHQHAVLRGLKGVTNPALTPIYLDLIASSNDSTLLTDVWTELKAFDRDAVVAGCLSALKSGDEKQVQAVSRLVASHLKERALGDAIKAALDKTEDRTTRLLGLSALSCVEADRFSAFFITHLTHDDPQVRTTAINCLAQCKEVNLYDTLEKTLADTDKNVRVAALRALWQAQEEHAPQGRILDYFTPSLLSPDLATRAAAVETLVPSIDLDNAQAALDLMLKMQEVHGTAGTEPLMEVVFRRVEADQAARVLQGHGYIARWHILGSFPSGHTAPIEEVDGFAFAYPPEQEIDLTKRYKVQYNAESGAHRKKVLAEGEIGWSPATVGDADAVLHMLRPGNAQLKFPSKKGVCYAYTELTVPENTQAQMTFLFSSMAQDRVWLNGKVIGMAAKIDERKRRATKTATITLNAGKNRLLVKMVSDDSSQPHATKISARAFSMRLTDKDGKPVKWSHE